jgi:dethiobiotin synthetase
MQKSVLITGTASGAGKTVVMLAIAAYTQHFCTNRTMALYQPIRATRNGAHDDDEGLGWAQSPETRVTMAVDGEGEPALLAAQTHHPIDLASIWQQYQALANSTDLVLIEAFGSLGTPLTPETTVADLAADWRLPTVLVVPVQPGAMGQAIAHVALARHSRVHLKGIILTCPTPISEDDVATVVDADQLQSMTQIPVLGCIPYLGAVGDRSKLAHAASNLDIEGILPFL